MPKLKNKSGAKKRFIFTAKSSIKMPQANKKHNMLTSSKKQIRNQRGMILLKKVEKKKVFQYIRYCKK